jgi:teichuronic acid exporter
MSLKRDAVWTAADTFVSAGLAFLFRLLVARALSPHDFGLAAIVLGIVAVLQVLNEFGLTSALIQKPESKVTPALVNTTFTASAIISVALALAAVVAIAPLAAEFYKEPLVGTLIATLAISLLPSPFTTVSSALLYRSRRYKEVAINRVCSTLASLAVAGVLLYLWPSPWVVIWQAIAQSVFSCIGLNLIVRWRFRLLLDRAHLKEVLGFSSFVLANDFAVSLSANAGVFILGRLVSVADVGLFGLASYMTDTVRKSLMSILNRVTFVHYSSVQGDKAALRKVYMSTLEWNCRVIFPVMVAFMLFGPELLTHFLGPAWKDMGAVVRWLSLSVMIHAAGGTTSTLYKGIGRPGLDMSLFLATTLGLLFPGMIAGAYYGGLVGVAIATAATKLVSVVIRQVLLDRLVGGTSHALVRSVLRLVAMQAPIGAAWLAARFLLPPRWETDVALMLTGMAVYGFLELPRALPRVSQRLKAFSLFRRNKP